MHKHKLIFGKQQFNYNFNNRKNWWQTNYEKYKMLHVYSHEYFMNFGSLNYTSWNCTGRWSWSKLPLLTHHPLAHPHRIIVSKLTTSIVFRCISTSINGMQVYHTLSRFHYIITRQKIIHKHELIFGKQPTVHNNNFNNRKNWLQTNYKIVIVHVYSHENFMLKLRVFKLHTKMILQQTPSSDTPTSGTPT